MIEATRSLLILEVQWSAFTRDGLERQARAGNMMPSTPRLGYAWSQTDERGRKAKGASLVVVPEEKELVELIFSKSETVPPTTLSKWLNMNGYRLPRKVPHQRELTGEADRLFNYKDIIAIVSDPIYTGTVEWGRTTKVPGNTPVVYSHHYPELQIISFEQWNRLKRIREQRKKLPPKAVGSTYIYAGLLRCPKCGGKTMGQYKWLRQYGQKEKEYTCRQFHVYGKAACPGTQVMEKSVTRAVIPFLADLLENKLGLRGYVEEEARRMVIEGQEGRIQRLRGQIEAARTQLGKVQQMTVQGLMTTEEAKPFIYEARETIERNQAQLAAMEQSIVVQKDLVEAISRICSDVRGSLERLEPEALKTIVQQVFTKFTVGKRWARWRTLEVWIEAYELRPEIQDLLAVSLGQDASGYPCQRLWTVPGGSPAPTACD
jgi:hypothetical protein